MILRAPARHQTPVVRTCGYLLSPIDSSASGPFGHCETENGPGGRGFGATTQVLGLLPAREGGAFNPKGSHRNPLEEGRWRGSANRCAIRVTAGADRKHGIRGAERPPQRRACRVTSAAIGATDRASAPNGQGRRRPRLASDPILGAVLRKTPSQGDFWRLFGFPR